MFLKIFMNVDGEQTYWPVVANEQITNEFELKF